MYHMIAMNIIKLLLIYCGPNVSVGETAITVEGMTAVLPLCISALIHMPSSMQTAMPAMLILIEIEKAWCPAHASMRYSS